MIMPWPASIEGQAAGKLPDVALCGLQVPTRLSGEFVSYHDKRQSELSVYRFGAKPWRQF
jgi:hypothetical protein